MEWMVKYVPLFRFAIYELAIDKANQQPKPKTRTLRG
jgi:hypothetical protein